MHHLVIARPSGADDLDAVAKLLDAAERTDGHRPLGDEHWIDAVLGGRTDLIGLLARTHDGKPIAYTQVGRNDRGWTIEVVVVPTQRALHPEVQAELLGAAIDEVRAGGGGHVHHWAHRPTAAHDEAAAVVGLRRGRDLLQLRRTLPVGEPATITTRPFDPGHDVDAWLAVNNRAFEWHPEQGGWTAAKLHARLAEPWVDLDGFLVHERDGRMAGFVWTKVHPESVADPALGEIFVIAVDPDFHGLGLGRELVLAGLDDLHRRRGMDVGMLYVDGDNIPALRLYEKLGFTDHHVDRAYVADI